MKPKPIHDAATIAPPLSPCDYKSLKLDIARVGLIDPITVFRGKVIDGRHRQQICQELGIEPHYLADDDLTEHGGNPYAFVFSRLQGRNLSDNQKAIAAAELLPHFQVKAKERQREHGYTSPGNKKSLSDSSHGVKGRADDAAGDTVGISGRTVSRAKKVCDSGCKQLVQAVRDDRLSISLAEKAAKTFTEPTELAEVVAVAMIAEDPRKALAESIYAVEPVQKPPFDLESWAEQYVSRVLAHVRGIKDDTHRKYLADELCLALEQYTL